MNKKIAVGILGYNSSKYLPYLLDSLERQSFCAEVSYFYIDNNSTDHSIDIVREHKLKIETIARKKNDGYAGAYNVFLKEKFDDGYDAVVLLNPDVIVDETWIENLILHAYSDPRLALVQSKILQLENDLTKTDKLSSFGGFLHYLGFGILNRDDDKNKEISFASGSCLLIKREIHEMCGGLDRDFFMYLEDVDISWRVQICGYECGVADTSIIWHHYVFDRIDDKKRRKFYYLERNRFFCLWKNYTYKTIFLIFPALVVLECGILVHAILHGYFVEKIRANVDFVKKISYLHKKHREVQSLRVVGDKMIFDKMIARVQFDELEGTLLKIANIFL